MKQWIFTGACVALVAAFSSTYAASGSATADKNSADRRLVDSHWV